MLKTQVRPSRDLRNNYADVMKTLEQHEYVVITNQGRGDSVLIDMDDFAKYQQALHNERIFAALQESKAMLDDPNVELTPHGDVMAQLRRRREERSHV